MNTEQQQQIEQMRKRRDKYNSQTVRCEYPELPTWKDIDFLLAIVKSQEANDQGWCSQCMKVVKVDAAPDGHIRPEHVAHQKHQDCNEEYPHLISECGMFEEAKQL